MSNCQQILPLWTTMRRMKKATVPNLHHLPAQMKNTWSESPEISGQRPNWEHLTSNDRWHYHHRIKRMTRILPRTVWDTDLTTEEKTQGSQNETEETTRRQTSPSSSSKQSLYPTIVKTSSSPLHPSQPLVSLLGLRPKWNLDPYTAHWKLIIGPYGLLIHLSQQLILFWRVTTYEATELELLSWSTHGLHFGINFGTIIEYISVEGYRLEDRT